ncbi:hypothetical protein QRX60_29615 [Amycolatopsis mongoliensis]|uniref:WXG100 family type VII secretion target n=1 Tax=Amycolatopsis mongoliensis TaxID=715475 RepID=A0A9Y2JHL3_9PSEU|nr:hypothetical protein [Amycolatopsis sp. 4-36]WIX98222.1 hypothetical protein QRX60_29615 [Amycolatopsis sp. 4-36]
MSALEPPPVVDPELQNLTFDQLTQLVDEVSPDVFYERAHAFEVAAGRFEQVQDDLERETRNMGEAWSGRIAESFDDLVRQVSGLTTAVVQAMLNPGYGVAMRRAGDALAQAQQRMRELQAQNRRGDLEAARQVLSDLGTAYRDIGAAMAPMPDAVTGLPAAAAPRFPLGHGPVAGQPVIASGQHEGAEGPGGRIGGIAPASSGAHHRTGSVAHAWPAVSPGDIHHETDCVVPAVLGRGVPEALPKASEQHGERRRAETAVVLGRSSRTTKPEVRVAPPRNRKRPTEHPATSAGEQHSKPEVAAEETVVTSAGPSHHEARAQAAPRVTSASAPAHAAAALAPQASAHVAAAPATQSPVEPPARNIPAAHIPASGHVAPAPHAGPASFPGVAAPGTVTPPGTPSAAGALPASPAFQPVAGGREAELAGAPPVLPAAAATPRLAGDHAATGGFMGAMFRGTHGQDEHARERDPAGFLGGEPGAWNSGGNGAPALGRPVHPPQPSGESESVATEELEKIKEAELRRLESGRFRRRREERDS